MCVINYMEMARVTGVPLSYLQVILIPLIDFKYLIPEGMNMY